MTAVVGRSNYTDEELAVIRASILAQPPTTISASVVDEHALFDDALRGAQETYRGATHFCDYQPPIDGLFVNLAPVGEDWYRPNSVRDQALVLEAGERARRTYNLPVRVLGDFTGGSSRRYQDYRLGAPMPVEKQAQLAEAVAVVDEFGGIDPYTTEALFTTDQEAVALLVAREYVALAEKFEALRTRLARAVRAKAEHLALRLVGPEANRVLAVASSPEFTKAVQMLDWLLPETHVSRETWRIPAGIELQEAIRRYEEESAVTDEWAFFADLDEVQWTAFQAEAREKLSNQHLAETEWLGWLRSVSDQARASMRHLAPLPPVVTPTTPTGAAITVSRAVAKGRLAGRHPFAERGRAQEA